MTRDKFVAIDFDGTITLPSPYPVTGALRPECVAVINRINEVYYTILWTHRTGEDLEEAVKICSDAGIQFDFINENPLKGRQDAKKIFFDYCIDDKNAGFVVDWKEIERIFLGE